MREFMDYVHSAFYEATGWNRDNSYAALNVTSDGKVPTSTRAMTYTNSSICSPSQLPDPSRVTAHPFVPRKHQFRDILPARFGRNRRRFHLIPLLVSPASTSPNAAVGNCQSPRTSAVIQTPCRTSPPNESFPSNVQGQARVVSPLRSPVPTPVPPRSSVRQTTIARTSSPTQRCLCAAS